MRRRDFISILGGAAATWPLTARAQPVRMRRIGVLLAAYTQTDKAGQVRIATFLKGLAGLGWTEGRNIRIEYRWGEGNVARVKTLAAELVQSTPDLILVVGDPALAELHRLESSIPIVFTHVSEPVDSGFVASLARPGGNITGFQNFEPEMGGKWLGVLKEAVPKLRRVGALSSGDMIHHGPLLRAAQAVAPSLGLALVIVNVRTAARSRAQSPNLPALRSGLLVLPHPNTIAYRVDQCACDPSSPAGDLSVPLFCSRWRPVPMAPTSSINGVEPRYMSTASCGASGLPICRCRPAEV